MPLVTCVCRVKLYQLLSELLLITQGPSPAPTTQRLPEGSQILAGEIEHSVLEEAVGYTCYSGMS